MVQYGLVDPKEHKKRKQADLNPLPMELRDEYVTEFSPRSTRSRRSEESLVQVTEDLLLLN